MTYAAWLEQLEGDARAERAGGFTEQAIADVRQRLNEHLSGDPGKVSHLPPDELALRRNLGVA